MKKEFILIPSIFLAFIATVSWFSLKQDYDIVYKKDIFVQTTYDNNCKKKETEHNLNAVHLIYDKEKISEKYVDIFLNEEKVGSFFIDPFKSIIYYPDIFQKNMHLETLFDTDNQRKIFLYLEQYPLIKNNLDKKQLNLSFRFKHKNESGEYTNIVYYNINTEKYLKDKNFNKISFNVEEYKNKISVKANSNNNSPYEILVQFKKQNTFYNQKHFDCKKNICQNLPDFFDIEDTDLYLGVLVFDRSQKEYTYEYKKEFFIDKKSKICYEKNAKNQFE